MEWNLTRSQWCDVLWIIQLFENYKTMTKKINCELQTLIKLLHDHCIKHYNINFLYNIDLIQRIMWINEKKNNENYYIN